METAPTIQISDEERITLDDKDCISLQKVLSAFSAPITEEHAWALIHQSLVTLVTLLQSPWQVLYSVGGAGDILLTREGDIHRDTFSCQGRGQHRKFLKSEAEAVTDLGISVYDALDYSLREDQ